jgi:DhnA family fructose-bisphosphate aldolase class Ia
MDARFLALACRICAEFGASVVKTYYCDHFEKITNGCPVPVVIAGGPKTDSELEVFQLLRASARGDRREPGAQYLAEPLPEDGAGLQALIHET